MTDIDLDALEATARAATPGAWEAGDVWVYTDPIYPDDRRLSNVLGMKFADEERAREEHARGLRNAEYIAAFDPPTSLALITRLREAEQAMTELTKDEEVTVEGSIFRWSELPEVLARNMRAVTEAQQEAKRWAVQAKGDRARLREAEQRVAELEQNVPGQR